MSIKQFAKDLKSTVEQIKTDGNETIKCDNLIQYLEDIASSPQPDEYERHNEELRRIEDFTQEANIEMFKSVIAAGQNAIKTSLILNGGAAIAMLAFIGHLVDQQSLRVALFAPTILPFALGAFLGGVTSGSTYLGQWLYSKEATRKYGLAMNIFCIASGAAAYLSFLWGLLRAYRALLQI